MAKRPFLVLPGGDCIPLEGAWRVTALRGEWYVLGHHAALPCESETAGQHLISELESQTDADQLASEAIETLGRLPDAWETDSLGELEPC